MYIWPYRAHRTDEETEAQKVKPLRFPRAHNTDIAELELKTPKPTLSPIHHSSNRLPGFQADPHSNPAFITSLLCDLGQIPF